MSLPVRTRSDLRPGDHIMWKRPLGYEHHAIVEYVNQHRDETGVIEYGSEDKYWHDLIQAVKRHSWHDMKKAINELYSSSGKRKAAVRRHIVSGVDKMYKYIYDKCDSAWQVLERARSKLKERAYNLLTNNCEHFATWCKTGLERSSQIRQVGLISATSGAEIGSEALGVATAGLLARCASAALENGTTMLKECRNLFTSGSPTTVLKGVGKAIAGGSRILSKGLKAARAAKVAGVVSLVTEVCVFGYSCYTEQTAYKAAIRHAENDEMRQTCKQQRNRNIVKAGFKGAAAIAGAAAGAALGSIVPAVGTAIGAAIGAGIGSFVGRRCGGGLGEWFGNRFIR